MSGSGRRRRTVALLLALLVSSALAGCGGSGSHSADATTLLQDTFSGSHKVTSGVLDLRLTITPTGSRLFKGPITFSLVGPFQSRGAGQPPASDLKVTISTGSLHGSLSVISTGTEGYVTMSGESYRLPKSSFRSLESGFAAVTGPAGGSSSSTGGSNTQSLGIDPSHWLSGAQIVGQESIGGVQTTHVRAKVDAEAMLTDLDAVLQSASSTVTGSGSAALSPKARAQLAKQIGAPSFNVWTGTRDRTLRQFSVTFKVPVTGGTSSSLGGLRSAEIGIRLRYTDLNRPQTIVAPTNLKPYRILRTKLASILAGISAAAASASGN